MFWLSKIPRTKLSQSRSAATCMRETYHRNLFNIEWNEPNTDVDFFPVWLKCGGKPKLNYTSFDCLRRKFMLVGDVGHRVCIVRPEMASTEQGCLDRGYNGSAPLWSSQRMSHNRSVHGRKPGAHIRADQSFTWTKLKRHGFQILS